MAHVAMFPGLVKDEQGNAAEVGWVGSNACYILYDDDFKRHIDAGEVDKQVMRRRRYSSVAWSVGVSDHH